VPFIPKTLLGSFYWGITLHPDVFFYCPLVQSCAAKPKRGTIGLALPGSTLKIVDPESLEDLPIGEMISFMAVEETVSQTIVDGDVGFAAVTLPDAKKEEKVMVLVAG
jgi:hypothetical protein